MKTISLVCEKGGVGKSMLASELRFYFMRSDLRVSLYALDGQYRDSSHVVDNPDVVIVPVRPTPSDTEPFLRTVDLVRDVALGTPLVVCVNGMNQWKVATSFAEWLATLDLGDETVFVPQSEAVVQALGSGHSVLGYDRLGHATAALNTLGDTVSELAGIDVMVGIW
jgi:chromosome partitioning protein